MKAKIFNTPTFDRDIVEALSKEGNFFFLLGASDTGKTTLALELANYFTERGETVALVDSDIGQSTFGPPTTIGLAFLKGRVVDFSKVKLCGMYFVGDVTPRGNFLKVAVGTKKMVEEAKKIKAQRIIVDSCGLVSPSYGEALKFYKIDLIAPEVIVALERGYELEHILHSLSNFKGIKITRLSVPSSIKAITHQRRRELREKGYRRYFKDSHLLSFKFKDVVFYPATLDFSKVDIRDVMAGLRGEEGKFLGVGIIREANFPLELSIFTPVERGKIKEVELGTLKLNSNLEEAGRIFKY